MNRLSSRFIQAVIVLWGAFTLTFILLQLLPGDAVLIKFLSPEYGLSSEQIAALRISYGLDLPVLWQYFSALGRVLQGDFGYSVQAGVSVLQLILTNLPPTLALAGSAFIVSMILAFFLAFLSIFAPFAWLKNAICALPGLFLAIPLFWFGIMLVQIFSFQLGLISAIAPGPIEGMILPIVALALPISAPLAQILIQAMDKTLLTPFVSVLEAKGASQPRIVWHHVLRNAALPTLTISGLLFGELLSGAVVTETVFNLNGIGKMTEAAVRAQDVGLLQAIVLLAALVFVSINLGIDLILPLIDPRLRKNHAAQSLLQKWFPFLQKLRKEKAA